jgi:hypothetical protein
MVEVGTYTPPGIAFGPINPVALLVFVTALLSSNGPAKPTEVSDRRWDTVVASLNALHEVTVTGG